VDEGGGIWRPGRTEAMMPQREQFGCGRAAARKAVGPSLAGGDVNIGDLGERFDATDVRITHWMAKHGIAIMRVALGTVFLWFGALKLFPGMSPAEDLVRATVTFLPGSVFVPLLGVWEMVIGLGFLLGRALRLTILLLFLQMPGTLLPVVMLPEQVFTRFPLGLTLEGQYIVKNVVLVAAALVIGATVRGGRLVEDARERALRSGNAPVTRTSPGRPRR
jgi:uncharacterized membrane protein YkgB